MTITTKALLIGATLAVLGAGFDSPIIMTIGIGFALGAIIRILHKRL